MTVGGLVMETIALMRAYQCHPHEWRKLSSDEDECQKCRVIATEAGKLALLAEQRRRGYAPMKDPR